MAWNKYPYTDNHELNLDWFLEQFKQLLAAWSDLQAAWTAYKTDLTGQWEAVEAAWQTYKQYIDDYFANLNVQTEINNKLDSMVASGEFLNIISPTVILQTTSETSRWLAEHIAQETGYVLDTSLTVAGAAADAKTTGTNIFKIAEPTYYTTLSFDDGIIPFYAHNGDIIDITMADDSTFSANDQIRFYGRDKGTIISYSIGSSFGKKRTITFNGTAFYASVLKAGTDSFTYSLFNHSNRYYKNFNDSITEYAADIDELYEIAAERNILNRFNKDTISSGFYLNTQNGNLLANEKYFASDYIYIKDIPTFKASYTHIICYYDKYKNFISGSTASSLGEDITVTAPENAYYMRFSQLLTYLNNAQIGANISRYNYTEYGYYTLPKYVSDPEDIVSDVIVDINGSGEYTSFTKAIYDTWNSGRNVVVKAGTYDIAQEYITLFGADVVSEMTDTTELNGFQFGVRLHNRTVTFEPGAFLVCDWSNYTVSGSRRFSAIRVDSDVTIIGMHLITTGTFYCVHDDYGYINEPFTNIYRNCYIKGNNLFNGNVIGGGCKRYSKHILDNCYFDNGRTNVTTVRYHNYALNQDAWPVIWASNCYFNSLFTPRWVGTQITKMQVYVNNCDAEAIYKLAEGSSTNDNIELYKWNNTERNPQP